MTTRVKQPILARVSESWDERDLEFDCWTVGRTWYGFACPLMTAEQLEVYIKCQKGHDRIVFDKNEGYILVMSDGSRHPATMGIAMVGHTPDGQALYDVGLGWGWELH